jgi:hypothetical protein
MESFFLEWNRGEQISKASKPLTRITPMAALPEEVAKATMVS